MCSIRWVRTATPLLMCIFCFNAHTVRSQDLEVKKLKALSMEELMEIEVISVSKRKEKILEAASAVQVITYEDIRNSGVTSLPEALTLATNLQVAQVNASQWAISARGFNNVLANKLLVLIDGRVVYTPMYAGVFWDVQNLVLEDIERIEVISGPGGTMWGANAVNGVINIITKNTRETQGLYAEAAAGTELRGLGSLRYGGKVSNKLSYRVYGTTFRRDNTIFRDSIEATDDWQIAQTGLRLDWEPTDNDAVTFQSNFYDDRPDPDGDHPVVARGSNALARWNHSVSERSDFQLQLFYDKTWRDFRNGFAEKLHTYDIEGVSRLALGKRHILMYGLGFRMMDHNVRNLELFAFKPAQKSLYLYNAFIQDEISLAKEKLRLTLGMKVERNTYTGFQYQPNVRLTWMASPSQTVWSAVSRAVRNPARIDAEFFLYFAPELPFIAGSDFQSEKLIAYELGWKGQTHHNLTLSVSAFYNRYDNIRSVEPGPPPFGIPVTFGNGVKGDTHGVELSLTYPVTSSWKLRLGYTYLNKDLKLKPGSADMNNGTAESNDPNHQALLQSTVQLFKGLRLGTVLRYVGRLPEPYISEHADLNVSIALKVTRRIELTVTGQNLLQDHHTEFIPNSPEPKDIERGVYGKLICRF
ncbi:TonB-dependent receptor plug domain-containing protein [Parachryseolinea silvisoli]|uniref:TonB-dependent receptor plug domain-containing protein n=1 Tax=Parachryseolinea silvisoli TaxID=2873601 RepID=UPI002265C851|nr:TonB-dependent receptor [Parachryseolinea silvisoli]MCD9018135.1 TonB-dependent receptor [Parachryseolinea silvisoli]